MTLDFIDSTIVDAPSRSRVLPVINERVEAMREAAKAENHGQGCACEAALDAYVQAVLTGE